MVTFETIDQDKTGTNSVDTKTIILWGEDDVLLHSVETVLNTRQDWKIARICDNWDDGTMIQEMKNVAPDAFILHEEMFLKKMHLFVKLAREFSAMKIITVSLENNFVNIYNRQTMAIKEARDLFSIIESNQTENLRGGAM